MNRSEQLNELFSALSKAQSALRGAKKDSKNPFYKSNYADLQSVWEAAREPLAANGLCVSQLIEESTLVTILGHISGQWLESRLALNPVKNDPQGIGSAISYARRYALAAIVGIHQTDDDGETAMNRVDRVGHAAQPEPEDGNQEPTHYRIPFGKFAQRTLEQVGAPELRNYVEYLESKAKKDGQEVDPNGKVGDFIKRVEDFVGSFENAPGQ